MANSEAGGTGGTSRCKENSEKEKGRAARQIWGGAGDAKWERGDAMWQNVD